MASPSYLDADSRYYSSPMKLFVVALLSSLKNADNSTSKLVFRPLPHQPRIYSGAPAGVHVTTVHAFDPDHPRKRVEYNLPNVLDYKQFVVDKASGNLSTAMAVSKTVGETYQVMVAAVSSGSSELEHLQIAVTEFNQFAPRFEHRNYTLELHPGTAEPDTVVLRVRASDPDPAPHNAEIYYRMDQNDSSRYFVLDSLTGELALNQPLNESEPLKNFGVFAEDGGSPKRWDYVPVIVVMKTVSAPLNISISNVTHDSALVCWDPPLFGSLSGYVVTYFQPDGEEKYLVNVTVNEQWSVCETLNDLMDDSEYLVQIYGWNEVENGQKTDIFSFNTTDNWCKKKVPCQAAGQCFPLPNPPWYTCQCPLGFYGPSCEYFDPCSLRPCISEQGRCVNTTHNEYVCACEANFTGHDCGSRLDPCAQQRPCHNGGTCEATVDGAVACVCPEGFIGKRCELVDVCFLRPCRNGGACRDEDGRFVCSCPDGFTGDTCEKNTDECRSNPCLHGSTCANSKGSFVCLCQPGFNGRKCEIKAQCPVDQSDTEKGVFYWNATSHGMEAALPCPFGSLDSNNGSYAYRSCIMRNGSAIWGPVNTAACKGKEFLVADEIADELHSMTKDRNTLNAETLETAAQGIETIATYATQDKKLAGDMVQVISNLMEVNDTVVKQNENFTQFSKSLLDIVDNFVSNVELRPGESFQVTSDNVRIHALDWQPNNTETGAGDHDLKFTVPNQGDLEESSDDTQNTSVIITGTETTTRPPEKSSVPRVKVYLPKEALQEAHRQLEGSVRVKFVVYYNDKLFQPKSTDEDRSSKSSAKETPKEPADAKAEGNEPEFKAPVLQISVGNVSLKNMYKPLIYVIPLTTKRDVVCVYWNAKERHWSTDGLTTNHTKNYVICQSTHMTAFSVLLNLTPRSPTDKSHESILSIISYVGSAFSIIGLTLTIITYLLFGCLNRDQTGRILSNLCSSLLLMNLTFLMLAMEPAIGGHFCAVLAILLHYLVLTSLSWMCVEAINMYQLLVHVFASSESHFMLKRCLAAWGGPLVIVGVTFSSNMHAYYEELQYCMLSPRDPWIYYCSFLSPACLLLAVNFAVFVLVSRVIFTPRLTVKPTDDPRQPLPVTAAQVRGAFTVMVLLGVTWVFGTLAVGELKTVFQYLFCVANSLQGFLIFLVRCLLYPEARGAWIHLLQTGRLKKHRGVAPPVGGTVSYSNSGGKNNHQSASRNDSTENAVVSLDGSLFDKKERNGNVESTKIENWLPTSTVINNNFPNEQGIVPLQFSQTQFSISKNGKNTFPKMQQKKKTSKRRVICKSPLETNPSSQVCDIFTIENSNSFNNHVENTSQSTGPNKEPLPKFVPATIAKRNLHLPFLEKQDSDLSKERRSASLDLVSINDVNNVPHVSRKQGKDATLSSSTIEDLKKFLANVNFRTIDQPSMDKRSFCADNTETSETVSKFKKDVANSKRGKVNRRMAFKRRKSAVFEREDEPTDDENSTSTDVEDSPHSPCADLSHSRRGSRKSTSSRRVAGNKLPKNTCYHCRFGNSCDDSSLPYTPPTSLKRVQDSFKA